MDIKSLIRQQGCFDLQFRKDIKKNRPNSPIYYRWKVQFIIIGNSDDLEKVKNVFGCGKIHMIKNQARFSVQNINEIINLVIPYFTGIALNGRKKNDFDLWAKGVEIIYKNKGKSLSIWKKEDLRELINIQKKSQQYKDKPKTSKWIKTAESLMDAI